MSLTGIPVIGRGCKTVLVAILAVSSAFSVPRCRFIFVIFLIRRARAFRTSRWIRLQRPFIRVAVHGTHPKRSYWSSASFSSSSGHIIVFVIIIVLRSHRRLRHHHRPWVTSRPTADHRQTRHATVELSDRWRARRSIRGFAAPPFPLNTSKYFPATWIGPRETGRRFTAATACRQCPFASYVRLERRSRNFRLLSARRFVAGQRVRKV